mgnify:FL=1
MIGSNLVAALNKRGRRDIIVVDHLKDGRKMRNLADLDIADYIDRDEFFNEITSVNTFEKPEAVFHLGACSSTTEWDGKFMMDNNYNFSKALLSFCQETGSQFIYASSASVYGMGLNGFRENRECEKPINMYAYSKFQFDQYIRMHEKNLKAQVVGLRYFNVYGPRETHKGSMSSTPYHFNNQLLQNEVCKLFSASGGYNAGEQRRDFIYVSDCVAVNLWFFDNPNKSGIFNVGTGRSQTFNEVAQAVLSWHKKHRGINGKIEYIPFPKHLEDSYQNHTEADITKLREAGYEAPFHTVEEGVNCYLSNLNREP